MYSVSENFLNKVLSPSREFDMKIEIGEPTIYNLTKESIVDWSIDWSMGNNGLVGIGGAPVTSFTMSVLNNIATEIVPTTFGTAPIKPYIGIDGEFIPLGIFYADNKNIERNDIITKVTCYDKMKKFGETAYTSNLSFPATLLSLANEMETKNTEIKFANKSNFSNVTWKNRPENIAYRDVLSDMAEMSGRNVIIDRLGKVSFIKPTPVDFTITGDNYIEFNLSSDTSIVINRLICKNENEEITYGTGNSYSLSIENNNITNVSELTTVYNMAYPFEYRAYKCKMQGIPIIDVGDIITLVDKNGVEHNLVIVKHTLTYNGGLISEISAEAPSQEVQSISTSSGSTISGKLTELNINLLALDRLYASQINALQGNIDTLQTQKLNTSDAYATFLTAQQADLKYLTTDTADARYLTAEEADLKYLTAEEGDLRYLTTEQADIKYLTTEQADSKYLTVENADIEYAKIDLANVDEIDAGKIKTGTLDAELVDIININADNIISGTLKAGKIEAQSITAREVNFGSIDAGCISDEAIGNVHIADGSLVGDKLADRTITGIKIQRDAISGEHIVHQSLNSKHINLEELTSNEDFLNLLVAQQILINAILNNTETSQILKNYINLNNNILSMGIFGDNNTLLQFRNGEIAIVNNIESSGDVMKFTPSSAIAEVLTVNKTFNVGGLIFTVRNNGNISIS